MKVKQIVFATFLIGGSLFTVGCSHHKKEARTDDFSRTSSTVAKADGVHYAVVQFAKGSDRLTEANKKELQNFVDTAQRDGRKIDDIKILAWADREYPVKGVKAGSREIDIADDRSDAIENYLKDDLSTSGDYASYNMAKRPNKVSELFRADDFKTKAIFEKSGVDFANNKASKALVMVNYVK